MHTSYHQNMRQVTPMRFTLIELLVAKPAIAKLVRHSHKRSADDGGARATARARSSSWQSWSSTRDRVAATGSVCGGTARARRGG